MKKLLSLTLTLIFSLSLIIPSFALAAESTIMPRSPICPSCNTTIYYQNLTQPKTVQTTNCPNHPGYYHLLTVAGRVLICPNCGTYAGADTSQSYGMMTCTFTSLSCFSPNPKMLWGSIYDF